MTTEQELAELASLAKKASAGKWSIAWFDDGDRGFDQYIKTEFDGGSASIAYEMRENDMRYIEAVQPAVLLALISLLQAQQEEIGRLREAVKPADDPESILHSLQIASMAAPFSDVQGNLYCHPPYSPDGYRDAEFRDYGLARAVRILCNNAKHIAAALASTQGTQT